MSELNCLDCFEAFGQFLLVISMFIRFVMGLCVKYLQTVFVGKGVKLFNSSYPVHNSVMTSA